MIQDKISAYFDIEQKSVGTRFIWYRDSKDWKPFHHDSAAFNPKVRSCLSSFRVPSKARPETFPTPLSAACQKPEHHGRRFVWEHA